MKYFFSGLTVIISCCAFGQNGYYFLPNGDTIYCEIKKVFPRVVQVKTEKKRIEKFEANEIKGFTKNGIFFISKKILNQKKNQFIFLPDNKEDGKYLYSDPTLDKISGRGITFYELTEFGGVSQYGRRSTITFYIENDSLGLTKIPYMSAIGSSVEKTDVINALYNYLKNDEATGKKLNVNESWKTFNYKGIRKLITDFLGKDFLE